MKNSEGKYKAEYRQGYWNSIDRTNDADDIAEFETEFGVYLKETWMGYLPEQIEKTKQLMASTILLLQILRTMVLLQKISHNPTNLAQ